ncbi:MAG: hypothetical protein HY300_13285 [Verrucomicrobia bacterium]|nr:hypothetical protein [Verrucomicrobiota bacterium]
MPNQDHRPQVTVEQLLRLKRAERPTDEFWTRFDRELRQKQLAALVEKRPWWQQVPQFLVRRTYLPIGATAILAFTLVSVKYYAPTELARVDESAGSPAVTVADNSAPARVEQSAPAPVAPAVSEVAATTRTEVAAQPAIDDRVPVAAPAATSAPVSAGDAAALIAWSAPAATETNSPSARNIAANIAQLEQTEPDLVSALNGRRNLTPRVQTASQGITELATVATNTSKRGRLLAQFNDRQFTPEPQAPEIVRERLARRLADPELVDRFSRIGLKGDQVSLKF